MSTSSSDSPSQSQSQSQSHFIHAEVRYPPTLLTCRWKLKVRNKLTGRFEPVRSRRNVFTDAGLTNLAKNWMGVGNPSVYLIIDNFKATINNASLPVGSSSVTLAATSAPHKAGDTQLILGAGLATQETVGYSGVTDNGNGTWSYSLTATTTQVHNQNEWAVRKPLQSDTLGDIKSEVQYDAVSFPNQRMLASGSGYSQGSANYVMQFFLTGDQALTDWVNLGLAETASVGTGTLMNHLVFGYTHTQGDDIELDISLTIANA